MPSAYLYQLDTRILELVESLAKILISLNGAGLIAMSWTPIVRQPKPSSKA